MLFHASFPSQDPARAAEAVARLWRGRSFPFPVIPDSFVAFENDKFGTLIEFYPAGRVLVPGTDEAVSEVQRPAGPTETHLAISTPLEEDEVHALAAEYGWLSRTCWRGESMFRVIELWIDNAYLFEVLTPEMQKEYIRTVNPDAYDEFLKNTDAAA
jgi:hypothetical protein